MTCLGPNKVNTQEEHIKKTTETIDPLNDLTFYIELVMNQYMK